MTVDGRPDLKVVTRQGYFDSRSPARLNAEGAPSRRMVSEIAGAETSNMVYDAVPLTVTQSAQTNKYDLHLQARSMGWTRAEEGKPRQCTLIVTVTLFDKKDKPIKTDARQIKLTAKLTAPQTERIEGPVTLLWPVPEDGKAVRARFVVRDLATGRMGTADADLLHPAPTGQVPLTVPTPWDDD